MSTALKHSHLNSTTAFKEEDGTGIGTFTFVHCGTTKLPLFLLVPLPATFSALFEAEIVFQKNRF